MATYFKSNWPFSKFGRLILQIPSTYMITNSVNKKNVGLVMFYSHDMSQSCRKDLAILSPLVGESVFQNPVSTSILLNVGLPQKF
jgi:hypothetical protein